MARIALITSSFDPWVGGVETHVRGLSTGLRSAGDDVEVWTVDRGQSLGRRTVDGAITIDFATPLPARDLGAAARFVRHVPRAWSSWSRAVRSFRPELLHVHCFGPNGLYAAALARRFSLPLVLTSHGETFGDAHGVFDQSALLRAGLRRAISSAAQVTAVSPVVADDLRNRFGAKEVRIIPNGIDLTAHSNEAAGSADLARPLFVAVGRLESTKGFDLLLRASASLKAIGVDHRVIIAGEGTGRRDLEALRQSLSLEDTVDLPGSLAPDEVDRLMRSAAAVVMPSRAEAFGIVALEAWRARVPLIASSLGGIRDFVQDGTDALLVDPDDTSLLAETIRRAAEDRPLAAHLVDGGWDSLQRFSWPTVTEDYRRLHFDVLSRSAG